MTNYKYVRTIEGIVYVGDCKKDENGDYCSGDNLEELEMRHKYIIKESDNIRDLIDEVVVIEYNKPILTNTPYPLNENKIVYGAIWTDKGLIYIARLKNNEWELI